MDGIGGVVDPWAEIAARAFGLNSQELHIDSVHIHRFNLPVNVQSLMIIPGIVRSTSHIRISIDESVDTERHGHGRSKYGIPAECYICSRVELRIIGCAR